MHIILLYITIYIEQLKFTNLQKKASDLDEQIVEADVTESVYEK